MKRTLYDIGADLQQLNDLLFDMGGDITDAQLEQEIDRLFQTLGDERDDKIRSYCGLIKQLKGDAEIQAKEAKRLSEMAATSTAKAKRLEERLKGFFEAQGIIKLNLGIFKPGIEAKGGVLPLLLPETWLMEPAKAPEAFQLTRIELNKDLVRERVSGGVHQLCPECGERLLVDAEKEGAGTPEYVACMNTACLWEGPLNETVRLGERGTYLRIR